MRSPNHLRKGLNLQGVLNGAPVAALMVLFKLSLCTFHSVYYVVLS